MWQLLIAPVSALITTVLNKTLPDKMSEAEKAQMALTLQEEVMKYDWSSVEKEYQDRADARALAAADVAKGNWFTNVLAASVRPFFGYIVMGAFVASFLGPVMGYPGLKFDDIQKEVMISVIYFYFGGRTVEKGIALWTGNSNNQPTTKT